jgi:hypothetical protein
LKNVEGVLGIEGEKRRWGEGENNITDVFFVQKSSFSTFAVPV